MTTKRFILMMLVMLMSVTGVWADEVTFRYKKIVTDTNMEEALETAKSDFSDWKIRTNNCVKISLDPSASADFQPLEENELCLRARTSSFIVEGLANTVIINSIEFKYSNIDDYITKQETKTFPNGIDYYQWGFPYCKLEEITVNYTDNHVHDYSGEWQMDATYHWQLCHGEGACKTPQGNKNPHDYGNSGAAYYTCSVCNYLSDTRKDQYELSGYKKEKIDALTVLVADKSDECKTIAQTYIGYINSAISKSAVDTQYNNALSAIKLQELKQEKISAIETIVEGVNSVVIASNVQTALTAIRAAATTAALNTAYNNAVNQLQSLVNIYNEGKADSFPHPTASGMRLKITTKTNEVYEFDTKDIKSTEFYRAEE